MASLHFLSRMNFKTQRWLMRVGFVALCLVPTIVIIGFATMRQFSSSETEYQQWLTERLNMAVHIQKVSFPRPNSTVLENISFDDLQTGESIATVRMIEVVQRDDTVYLIVSQPYMEGVKLDRWWKVVQQLMNLQGQDDQPVIRLVADDLTINSPSGKQTLVDFLSIIEPTENGTVGSISFRLAGNPSKDKITIRVSNHLQEGRSSTKLQLNTASGKVPCALFTSIAPSLKKLDETAMFQGRIWAQQTGENWSGEIAGSLTSVNLDTLITDQFPHKLSGIADIKPLTLKFQNNRVYEARGELWVTAAGYISRSLIDAAVKELGLNRNQFIDIEKSQLAYRQLAFAFEATSRGVSLFGRCRKTQQSAILTYTEIDSEAGTAGIREKVLLRQSTDQPRATLSLIRTLVPQTDVRIPASREANQLLPYFPLPSYKTDGNRSPKIRLRQD